MYNQGMYATLGRTGLCVSRIALGCGFRGVTDATKAVSIVRAAVDRGINFIDCANVYRLRNGEYSEAILAQALQGCRDRIVITSKFGVQDDERRPVLNAAGASRRNMIQCVEASLRRLCTDYIDVYFLHRPDNETAFEETLRAFEQLCRDGKIRYAGLCNHKGWQIAAMQEMQKRSDGCPISVIQNSYNLLNRSGEEDQFPAAQYEGIGVMTYSPLATGLLGGAFAHNGAAPEKSTWAYDSYYAKYLRMFFPGKISEIVNAVQDIADRYGVSSASIATAWALRNQTVTSVIAGADSIAELDDSLLATTLELEAEDYIWLDQLSDGMRKIFTHLDVQKQVEQAELAEKRMRGEANGNID